MYNSISSKIMCQKQCKIEWFQMNCSLENTSAVGLYRKRICTFLTFILQQIKIKWLLKKHYRSHKISSVFAMAKMWSPSQCHVLRMDPSTTVFRAWNGEAFNLIQGLNPSVLYFNGPLRSSGNWRRKQTTEATPSKTIWSPSCFRFLYNVN